MEDSGVNLITVEMAYGDRQFEVTSPDNPHHIQLRTRDELWHKENLLNLGFQRMPLGVKYFGYCDADLIMTRPDWAQETLQALQLYDIVQPFSSYADLDSNQRCSRSMPSFAHNYVTGQCIPPGQYGSKPVGAVGGAWAYRVEAFNAIGGLLDKCILGSGDWHMAMGLVGRQDTHPDMLNGSPAYVAAIKRWQQRSKAVNANIGCVENHAIHHWHGSKAKRGYVDRVKILVANEYDPDVDIYRDYQGAYVLSPGKPRLRDGIRAYFRSRNEDEPTFYELEKTIK
jgi:hypothetical protein